MCRGVERLVPPAFAHTDKPLRRLHVGPIHRQLPVVHLPQRGQVVVGRQAAEHSTESKRKLCIEFGGGPHRTLGEHAGGLDPGRVVERRERMQRCAGAAGPHVAGLPVGHVEHVGGVHRPPPERIEAAAVEVGSMRGRIGKVPFLGDRQGLPDLIRLIGIDRLAADPPVEQAAGSKRDVAKHHRRHAEPAGPREEPVLGILGEQVRGHLRRLPVGGTGHQQPVHLLLAPRPVAKLHGQPVE